MNGLLCFKKKGPSVTYTDDVFLDESTKTTEVEANEEEEDDSKLKIGIFVGSQTGTAQEFAETLETEGAANNFNCTVVDLEDFEPGMFKTYQRAIFCVATYGEGDPCDNAADFDEWLKNEAGEDDIEGLRYVVFGLGNKQYEHYNAQGRFLDKTFESLGAQRMYKYGEGDDDGSLEDDFEEWKKDLWISLRRSEYGETDIKSVEVEAKRAVLPFVLKPVRGNGRNGYHQQRERSESEMRKIGLVSKPYFETQEIKVVANRELRQTSELGSTRHVELDVKGTRLQSYHTADNLGIIPCNRPNDVNDVATLLGYDLDAVFDLVPNPELKKGKEPKLIFPTPCSTRRALTVYCDLHASPSRPFLRTLAAYARGQERERLLYLASAEGVEEYKRTIVEPRVSLASVLRSFVALDLSLEAFVQICPRNKERLYTIASSPAAHPNRIHLAVTVVEERVRDDGVFRGLCSGFLDEQRVPDRSGPRPPRGSGKTPWPSVHAFLRESSFKAPKDPSTPLIMFGPGTGIAPMRALLQDRLELLKRGVDIGPSILFFGCCKRDVDFIYKDELQDFLDAGALTELHLAFSREQKRKVYVQHKMREQGDKIWKLVDRVNAHVYVCGGIAMGNDVSTTMEIIAKEAGVSDAKGYVADMKRSGRYIQELWS